MDLYELPLFNWIKCNDGELKFCRIDLSKGDEKTDAEIWQLLYDKYIKKYGLGKLYKKLLQVMKEKAIHELEYVVTKDRFKLTESELKEIELKNMIESNNSGMTTEQSIIYLSKWLGYRLNPKEVNVIEYFNILEQYGKENTTK
jgi:hypothetical protein